MEALLESRSGLWAGGPAPGQFYRIPSTPGSSVDPASALYGGPITRTQNPMVTGTSVLGLKFEGGVVIAADMLGSYGSLARFRNISRIMRVNNSTMLGASGDYADFQYLKQVLGQMVFLGYVDMLGVAYEAPSLATGYGAYLAQPLLREVLEKQPVLSQTEARELVERCMRVLYYRDARSYNRFQIATVTEKGVEIEGPLSAETNWDIAHMISGFE
ncbi:proteasome subunit beta type-4 isoform X2 [Bubalus kerabau]|uniref:proteasome subunit beta type-4 isoform X2 n=1 Tax=Bubalus carabanensis TaxID=3119969 RepID=UPI00244E6E93|nr:proteasome subunit beta type-4 isoform X2 [Bubalus carabanensis]